MDSPVAQWLVSSGVDSHLTLDWLKWHYYHVCIANGFPGAQSRVGNMRLACQLEVRTHMSQTRGPFSPKSILTPLKRFSASMALQRNYPVCNDISTQFLPAFLSSASDQLPQARWKLCGLRTVIIWSLRGYGMEKLWSTLPREQLLSNLWRCAEPVPQSDWMWCSSLSCQDNLISEQWLKRISSESFSF